MWLIFHVFLRTYDKLSSLFNCIVVFWNFLCSDSRFVFCLVYFVVAERAGNSSSIKREIKPLFYQQFTKDMMLSDGSAHKVQLFPEQFIFSVYVFMAALFVAPGCERNKELWGIFSWSDDVGLTDRLCSSFSTALMVLVGIRWCSRTHGSRLKQKIRLEHACYLQTGFMTRSCSFRLRGWDRVLKLKQRAKTGISVKLYWLN